MEEKIYDSNHIDSDIRSVCFDCGNKVRNNKPGVGAITTNKGQCDYCGEKKTVTNVRNFGYPDFSLIQQD